jgi:peptidoglycan/LPS O-acetylase OafA/YrhL
MLAAKSDFFGADTKRATRLTANQKIDLCRGLFAFLVVAAHSVDMSWSIHPAARTQYPWWVHDLLLRVAAAGVYWVIGFFVISGYCIQLSVSRSIEGNSFPLTRYLAARLTRILPIYYLGLVFAVVVERLIASARPPYWGNGINVNTLISQLFVVQNLTQTFGSYAPSWSITNEMLYYIFYGLIVCVALRKGIRATSAGMAVCVGVALAMEVVHFRLYRSPFTAGLGALFGMGTIWFMGALVAENRLTLARSRLAKVGSACWPLVLLLGAALWFSQRVHMQVLFMVLAAAFSLMLIRFVTVEGVTPPRRERRWATTATEILGQSSYPTYLFHGPLLMLVGSAILRWNLVSDWRITWAILFFVGVSSGIALGFLVEKPILDWRKSFLRRFESPRASTVGSGEKVRIVGVSD